MASSACARFRRRSDTRRGIAHVREPQVDVAVHRCTSGVAWSPGRELPRYRRKGDTATARVAVGQRNARRASRSGRSPASRRRCWSGPTIRPDVVIALVVGVPSAIGMLLILLSGRRWVTTLGAFILAIAPGWFGVLVVIQVVTVLEQPYRGTHRHRAPWGGIPAQGAGDDRCRPRHAAWRVDPAAMCRPSPVTSLRSPIR